MRKLPGVLGLALILVLVPGCLNNSEEGTVDYSTPRTNSEAGIAITVTYLPEIEDTTLFRIEVTAHRDYDDLFETNSYLRDSEGKPTNPFLMRAVEDIMPAASFVSPGLRGNDLNWSCRE